MSLPIKQPVYDGTALNGNPQAVDADRIPSELKELRQWVCWRLEHKPGAPKPTKIPVNPTAGYNASTTDPNTWSTFADALAYFQSGKADGIGFIFSPDDDYVGIDLDGCRDPVTGIIDGWALQIVEQFASYAEISPSGTGLHIIVQGSLPEGRRKKEQIEVYSEGRYFTMTGKVCQGAPPTIESRTSELSQFHQDYLEGGAKTATAGTPVVPEDGKLIERAKSASNGDKFSRLWSGDISGYSSASEADLALCSIFAYWTGGDAARIDRIFRTSRLFRAKWDERHGKSTYGEMTIEKALLRPPSAQECGTVASYNTGEKKANQRFEAYTEAEALLADGLILARRGGILHIYDEDRGMYIPGEDQLKRVLAKERLKERWTPDRASSVLEYLRVTVPDLWDRPPLDRLNVMNGILNLETLELEPHSPDFLSSFQIKAYWEPSSKCPRIEKFFEEVFPEDVRPLASEIPGYLCMPDNSFQKAFLLVGDGNNGKSTYLKLVEAFLGPENVSNLTLQTLGSNRFAASEISGKLANVFADLPNLALQDVGIFKAVVGGDSIRGERKYGDGFSFTPYARFIFSANEIPSSPDTSHAYSRRWIVIPFPNRFDGEAEVKDLINELTSPQEMSGLLVLAISAYRGTKQRGAFTTGESTTAAGEEFKASIDPVLTFINEMTYGAADARAGKTTLYRDYQNWAKANGRHPVSAQKFNTRLKQHVLGLSVATRNGIPEWIGIGSLYFEEEAG